MVSIHKGYSQKKDGSMYLATSDHLPENITNRERYFARVGPLGKKIVAANLTHGTRVAIIDASSPEFLLDTDALVTKEFGITLTLTGADCFPVYFKDTKHGIIGLAHCGWKGIIGGILQKTLETIESLGGTSRDIFITIGPGICEKHFEIKEDILGNFFTYPEVIIQTDKRIFIDLKTLIKIQLEQLGIMSGHIIDQNECTYCLTGKYFSYRRDKPAYIEAQVAYITQGKR